MCAVHENKIDKMSWYSKIQNMEECIHTTWMPAPFFPAKVNRGGITPERNKW
jgi:hypothetical protein